MLNRLALRLATVRALRGRTLAGANVRDSEMAPIADVANDEMMPLIVVYTDDGKFTSMGRDLFATVGDARVDVGFQNLIIEIAITQRMQIRDDNGDMIVGAIPPVLDAALECNIDFIEREVYSALMDADPSAVWSSMWQGFAPHVGERDSQRGSLKQDGVRLAGRQIRLAVKLPRDPTPGAPIGPLWSRFLALATADAELATLVPMLERLLAGTPLPPWRQTMRTYGINVGEARAMLIAPPPAAEAVADPVFDEPNVLPGTVVPPTYPADVTGG
jgi:hypothetical protein